MNIYEFQARTIEGKELSLSEYRGKALLIVNVASRCGYTPQYEGLERLYAFYKDQGFAVLGFPCNQFGAQEPGTEADIQTFCSTSFNVRFPLFSKVDVNGSAAHPLYKFLTSAKPGILGTEAVKWNFTKFLLNRQGEPVKRYAPTVEPKDIEEDIRELLVVRA